MSENKPFLNSDEELPWEVQDREEREAAELEAEVVKPKPRPKVPEFNAEAIKAQSNVDSLRKQVETAEDRLREVIARGDEQLDPQGVLNAIVGLAEVALRHDMADRDAAFLLIEDEQLPMMVADKVLAYERSAVELDDIRRRYGDTSLTYQRAVEAHAALGAERRTIEAEMQRRAETVALDEGHVRKADDDARRAFYRAAQDRVTELENTPDVDLEALTNARALAATPWDQIPERESLRKAALLDVQEESQARRIAQYVEGIVARFTIDEEIGRLYGQTQANTDHLIAVRQERLEAEERRRQVEAAIAAEAAAKADTEFGRALTAAQKGIISMGGAGGNR